MSQLSLHAAARARVREAGRTPSKRGTPPDRRPVVKDERVVAVVEVGCEGGERGVVVAAVHVDEHPIFTVFLGGGSRRGGGKGA